MLEKYRIWQKPVIDKKKGKMRFDQKKWQYGFPGTFTWFIVLVFFVKCRCFYMFLYHGIRHGVFWQTFIFYNVDSRFRSCAAVCRAVTSIRSFGTLSLWSRFQHGGSLTPRCRLYKDARSCYLRMQPKHTKTKAKLWRKKTPALGARWWFQTFFGLHPYPWGNDPNWLIFFKWVETTN